MNYEKTMTETALQTKINELIQGFDELEKLFKSSQLVEQIFATQVLNEYRYFSRAFIDYKKANSEDQKYKALSRAEVALSSAFNDIIDSIINHIGSSVKTLRAKYPLTNLGSHLNELGYKKVLDAIDEARKVIIKSRMEREFRFKHYLEFTQKVEYQLIINFALQTLRLEFLCETQSSQSENEKKLYEAVSNALLPEQKTPNSKLELHIQPKFDVINTNEKTLIGGESLIRLKVGNKLVFPNDFMKIVYQAYLEEELTFWVLKETIDIIKEWRESKTQIEFNNFRLSVNIPPSLLKDSSFYKKVATLFNDNEFGENICFEITENWVEGLDNDQEFAIINQNLKNLHNMIEVSIDDFGSGSTKLKYLADLHRIDEIKLDKILVDGLITNNTDAAKNLITGAFCLADKFKLSTIAEGVECKQQVEELTKIGISKFQGYYFGRPCNKEDFYNSFILKEKGKGKATF